MFEKLKEFDNIVVSGPQRSGTRIVAKAIAHDTAKTYIDEKDINYHDYRLLEWHLLQGGVVIQCPALCHLIHRITAESTLVVMVRRSIEEIIASEFHHLTERSRKLELFKYGCSEGVISRVKYDFWNRVQREILSEKAREIRYHELEDHPLFIKERKGFRWDQTQ